MITLNMKQGTDEWKRARLGIPTASQFHRIITAKTLKPSASAQGYLHQLLAEWMLGEPLDEGAETPWMVRGTALEDEAVRWYELQRDATTTEVGLCLLDDRSAGCSPDRLVGADGGLEIKCPSAAVHVGYLLGDPSKDHYAQVQGALWITGRQWWDVLSYNPSMPQALIRVERDEEFIAALAEGVAALTERMSQAKQILIRRGYASAA